MQLTLTALLQDNTNKSLHQPINLTVFVAFTMLLANMIHRQRSMGVLLMGFLLVIIRMNSLQSKGLRDWNGYTLINHKIRTQNEIERIFPFHF